MAQQNKASNEEVSANHSMLSRSFDVAIAIDFGTDGLGVAYAVPPETKVFVHDKWKSKNYGTIVKPKTILLFTDKFKVANIGLDAKHSYINLSKKKDTWMLFERFKMSLFGMFSTCIYSHKNLII